MYSSSILYLVDEARVLVEVPHLVVKHRGEGPAEGGHDPAPLRGTLPPDPLLAEVVGHELLRGRVVVNDGSAVLAERVHHLKETKIDRLIDPSKYPSIHRKTRMHARMHA